MLVRNSSCAPSLNLNPLLPVSCAQHPRGKLDRFVDQSAFGCFLTDLTDPSSKSKTERWTSTTNPLISKRGAQKVSDFLTQEVRLSAQRLRFAEHPMDSTG